MKPSLPILARILPGAGRTLSERGNSPFPSVHPSGASRLTVDAPTRVFHWLFAMSLVGAYLTGDSEWWRSSHIAFGYMMIALVTFRLIYGLIGPRHVGLSALLKRASGWSAWMEALKPGQRTPGRLTPQLQHLFTASVVLLLMVWIVPVFVTGYAALHEWDKLLGGKIFETLHEVFANGFLVLIALHLVGLLLFSLVRRRNLAAPMLTGRTPGSGPSIVQRNRVWLGWLLTAGVLAFGAWEWANAETVPDREAGLGSSRHTGMILKPSSPLTAAP
jgi:cytochrome b